MMDTESNLFYEKIELHPKLLEYYDYLNINDKIFDKYCRIIAKEICDDKFYNSENANKINISDNILNKIITQYPYLKYTERYFKGKSSNFNKQEGKEHHTPWYYEKYKIGIFAEYFKKLNSNRFILTPQPQPQYDWCDVAFKYYCDANNIKMVKYIHKKGANLTSIRTGFNIACENGNLKIVRYLHAKEKINVAWNCHMAIENAIRRNHVNVVEYLYESGSRRANDKIFKSIMDRSINAINFDLVMFFRKKNLFSDSEIQKMLEIYLREGDPIIIKYAHENLIDIKKHIQKAFYRSIEIKNLDLVKYFHHIGAKIDCCDKYLINLAIRVKYFPTIIYIIENDISSDKFMILLRKACKKGNLEIIEYLYGKGFDICFDKNALIQIACQKGYLNIVKFLHKNGADIFARKNTALHLACEGEHFEIAEYLCECGADVTARNNLAIKISCSNYVGDKLVKLLHKHGADLHFEDDLPLKIAKKYSNLSIILYLTKN